MDGLFRIAIYLAAGYLLIVGLAYIFQRNLLYFPSQRLPAPAQVGLASARIAEFRTADGLVLVAWHVMPRDANKPTVLLFHGNGGNIADRAFKAQAFAGRGYGVLLAEYRGYGGNPGNPSEEGLYDDGRSAIRYLKHAGVGPNRMVLHGESLGSGVAVRMAAEFGAAALVLESPYTSIADVAAAHYPYLPVRLLIKDRFVSVEAVGNLKMPLLIVHGQDDRIIPTRFGRALLQAASEPKEGVFVPRAGHNDLWQSGGGEAVLAFLGRLFPG